MTQVETSSEEYKNLPRWDLSKLYKSSDDSIRHGDLKRLTDLAEKFQSEFRGKIQGMSSVELRSVFDRESEIHSLIARLSLHAFLSFAANTQDEKAQAMVAQIEELSAEVASRIVFFDLELGESDRTDWLESPELEEYRFQIARAREKAKHNLSEELESYSLEKNLTGKNALTNLFDEFFGQFRVHVKTAEGEKVLTEEEALAALHSPDREYRTNVFMRFLDTVGDNRVILSNIYNSIALDHRLDTNRRAFPDLMAPRNLSNQVSGESVNAMLDTVESGYEIARRYFRLKAKVLGLTDFTNADVYAPLTQYDEKISYSSAVDLCIKSYERFHPQLGDLVKGFFDDTRVDAALVEGKRSGAFCYGASPDLDAYVHLNFTGDIRSVQTLAHELGHGVHHQLSKRNNFTNFDTPLTTAETASVFGEILLNETLIAGSSSPEAELSILASQMEGIIATVFRQTVLTRFEQRAHGEREKGRVSADRFCELWWEENGKLYGDAVRMVEPYRWGWAYIPHFVHTPFYCYAYSFGQLLVLSLYNEYLQKGESFREGYIELLSLGGSDRPENLVKKTVGLDVSDHNFWASALNLLTKNLERIEELARRVYPDRF